MPDKYSIDSDNRLIIRRKDEDIVTNGHFSIDDKNRLVYRLNEPPVFRKQYKLPEKIVFTGKWKLDSNYDLELELQQDKSSSKQEIIKLKGEIISCEAQVFVYEIKAVNKNGLSHFRLLKLTGNWGTDNLNQISFTVDKKDSSDSFVFKGAWQLNNNQQIVYTYEKTQLKTKNKHSYTLTFSGFWEINSGNRLVYVLSKGTNSRFDFKVQIQSPTLYPKDGVIKFKLGAGIRQPSRHKPKIISLYGAWKFSRKAGLTFDMRYSDVRINSISFGAEINFNRNNEVIFNLTAGNGENLGFSLMFTHKFLKQFDAELFTKLKHLKSESRVEGGIRIPF